MSEFYHPYQFIPVKKLADDKLLDYQAIRKHSSKHPARHDLWQNQQSGRIVCTIYLEVPLLLGLEHEKTTGAQPNNLIKPQQRAFGKQHCYYIPGNTLRGATSSIAEALTNSSLRVLENTALKISLGRDKANNLGDVYDYFGHISNSLLPLGVSQRRDQKLTPAELIFGCVELQDKKDSKAAFALSSRVRFSDAKLIVKQQEPLLNPMIIKVLGTPKTNSHNLYYHPRNGRGQFIRKGELNSGDHCPNGRKFYLHATSSMVEAESWKISPKDVQNPKIHIKGQPFKQDQVFQFNVDFENLSAAELSVLVTSLRPAKDFRHKLGMGKPLGLGTVRLDIQGVFFIDRPQRYARNALQQQRYSIVQHDVNSHPCWENLRDYQEEAATLAKLGQSKFSPDHDLIDEQALGILKRIGQWPYTADEDDFNVEYPSMENSEEIVTGTGFDWFVQNEKNGGKRALGEVKKDQPLPRLPRYRKQES